MVGKEILGYHVDEKIGTGGFGTVYKVSKTNAAGTYTRALKHIALPTKKQYASVLNSMGGDYAKADDYFAGALKDIVNEIKILSSLSESGVASIVRYYENDIIETDSPKSYDIYIMMEYLTPLSDYIEKKDITVADVLQLGKDILAALTACHGKNIIHRDIKDDNIFVSPEGMYKLGDFGVSKSLQDRSRAESVKGTPNFIAPEVYLGKEKYDNTVDLYSLGIVLYKFLNNARNPFMPPFPQPYNTDDENAAFEARMTGKIPELPSCAQNALGNAVLKAIMPRAERYNSAAEFLQALEEAERTLTTEELAFVVSHALREEAPQVMDKEKTKTQNKSFDETIGSDLLAQSEDSVEENEDRHLFDTFAAPAATHIAVTEEKVSAPKAEKRTEAIQDAPTTTVKIPTMDDFGGEEKKKKKGVNKRALLFTMPFVFAVLYISFYVILIPALYGQVVSVVDWIIADVGAIVDALEDINNVLMPVYTIVLLVILQYALLALLLASIFLACKELHKPSVKASETVKYTGKMPYTLVQDAYQTLKSNTAFTDKNALTNLRMVMDSMNYSKPFGFSCVDAVEKLEDEICRIIDVICAEVSSDTEEVLSKLSGDIATLKQKSSLRDAMLKK